MQAKDEHQSGALNERRGDLEKKYNIAQDRRLLKPAW